ncbi:MAG TPA: N-acetyltransferase [Gemmatimonadaceae bacterium]|nr:N-acetyltransferase [Gemmatimonadaceae bacterium]
MTTGPSPFAELTVRAVRADEAARLAELAEHLFRHTYVLTHPAADLELYVSQAFGAARQAEELADPSMTTLLAESPSGETIGYAQLRAGPAPLEVPGARPVEVARFYVAAAWHGHGVAARLMDACRAEAHRRGGDVLWLGVWEENARAIAFYRKSGFAPVGTQAFQFGSRTERDFVMSRFIAPLAPLLEE